MLVEAKREVRGFGSAAANTVLPGCFLAAVKLPIRG